MSANFADVRGILSDMDGVWFVGNDPVGGARAALAEIRSRQLPVRFVTNTTALSLEQLADKMRALGLQVASDEIISSPQATALHLAQYGNPTCHLLAYDNVAPLFDAFPRSQNPDFVVLGDIGDAWNYSVLQECFRMLMGGARLVAMHKGRYWQTEAGLQLDIGAFVTGLEYATGCEATIVGKPSAAYFAAALAHIGVEASQVMMIGDDIRSDIGGAMNVGMRGVLVKTGKYRDTDIESSGITPDAVIDSIASLPELL